MKNRPLLRLVLVLAILFAGVFLLWRAARENRSVAQHPTANVQTATANAQPEAHPEIVAPVAVPAPRTAQVFSSAWDRDDIAQFTAFHAWTGKYFAAPAEDRAVLLADGRRLAQVRRAIMAELIRKDPRSALEHAVPMVVRERLPEEIVALLEERVSGRGQLALEAVTPEPGGKAPEPSFRATIIAGKEYRAYVYGRREAYATVGSTSMVGIAVDNQLAIAEEPLRVLEPGEKPATRPIKSYCACGAQRPASLDTPMGTDGSTLAVEYAGIVQVACSPEHIQHIASQLLLAETSPRTAGDNLSGTSGVTNRPAQSWTHGTKKILVIRVDFSDIPGTPVYPSNSTPITDDYVVNLFNNAGGIADFYAQGSYGKTALSMAAAVSGDSPDVTPVYRMPSTGATYATTGANNTLHTDAQALATTGGYTLANYDRIIVVFPRLSNISGTQITYGGLGDVEGTRTWINGWFDFRVVAHEIGHNYGLNHANLWKVTDGNPVSPSGTSEEYGDPFDVMGINGDLTLHFSQWGKSLLHWIPDTAVETIQSSGTYRVYRFDDAAANLANSRALKVVRDSVNDYWIGYRRATSNASLDGGAYVLWGYNTNHQSNLLDLTTPGNSTSDAGLAIGATFNDTLRGISIHPVAQGGSGAEEYLDVQIDLLPLVQWSVASVTVGETGGSVTLSVTRTRNSSGAVSVNYATASGTATSGTDFTATSGTLNWADGDTTTKTITIPITADAVAETSEDFTVTLSGVSGAVLSDLVAATVTVLDPGMRDGSFSPEFVDNTVEKILPLPDGNAVLGGWFSTVQDAGYNNYSRGGLTKMDAAGKLAPAFASAGGAAGGTVYDLALQPDGKIIVAGSFSTMNGTARNNLARLNADGSLDNSFNPGSGANATVYAVLLSPDGKIFIGGSFTSYDGIAREYLARLNADGSLDSTWTGPDFASTSGWRVESLAFQADGKLLAGGVFYFAGGNFRAGLCRLDPTGALDATFTGVVQGAHLAGNTGSLRSVRAIIVQPDGNILIGGSFTAFNNTARGGIARLLSDGSLDTGFAPTSNGDVNAIAYLPDGRILVGGAFTTLNSVSASRLALLTSNGTIPAGGAEEAFAGKGGHGGTVADLALLPDGSVLMGTNFATFQGSSSGRPIWRFAGPLNGTPGTVQFAATSVGAVEGGNAVLTVSRNGTGTGALTIGYSTVVGTAGTADFTATYGTLTWANGDLANKTITVPISSDAVADAGETFAVQLGQPLVGGAILGANRLATVTVSEPLTGYAAFNATNFTAGELADTAISGPNADPDMDGLPNLVEYALGLNPKAASTTGLPAVSVAGSDWVFTYTKLTSATDVTYTPQFSTNLTAWGTGSITQDVIVSTSSGVEAHQTHVPVSTSSTAFFRLMIVR